MRQRLSEASEGRRNPLPKFAALILLGLLAGCFGPAQQPAESPRTRRRAGSYAQSVLDIQPLETPRPLLPDEPPPSLRFQAGSGWDDRPGERFEERFLDNSMDEDRRSALLERRERRRRSLVEFFEDLIGRRKDANVGPRLRDAADRRRAGRAVDPALDRTRDLVEREVEQARGFVHSLTAEVPHDPTAIAEEDGAGLFALPVGTR